MFLARMVCTFRLTCSRMLLKSRDAAVAFLENLPRPGLARFHRDKPGWGMRFLNDPYYEWQNCVASKAEGEVELHASVLTHAARRNWLQPEARLSFYD